jgi:hypothetical protein
MRKVKTTLTVFIALIMCSFHLHGVTVQIGSGTTTNQNFPIASCYGYSYTQQIYLQSEVEFGGGGAGPVTSISFFYSGGGTVFANWKDWTIYLGNTSRTSFSSNTDWVPVSEMTAVFSGEIPTPVAGSWLTITLAVPFAYSGDNIIVAIHESTPGWSCTANWLSFASGSSRGLVYRNDSNNPDPADPPTASFAPQSTIAQVQFEMTASPLPPNCANLISPADGAVDVSKFISLQWAFGGGAVNGYKINFGTDNPPSNIQNGTDLGNVTSFAPALDYSETYYWQIVAYNDNGDAEGCEIRSFTTMDDPTITVFPYTEGFDDPTFPPPGWTNVKTGGPTNPGTWDRQTTGTNPTAMPYSGVGMARYNSFFYRQGNTADLVSPPLNIPDDNFWVTFWMYRDQTYTSTADRVNVYFNTINSSQGGTLLGTINRSRTLEPVEPEIGWYQYSFFLPEGSAGDERFIIFEGVSAYGNNIFIDEITIEEVPSCLPPTELTADFIKSNSAVAQWNSPEMLFQVKYNEGEDFDPVTEGTLLTPDPENTYAEISALTPNTNVFWYVRAVCDVDEFSVWNGPVSFATTCAEVAAFFEDFDMVTTPLIPECWQKVGNTGFISTQTNNNFSSPNCLLIYSSSNTNIAMIALPPVNNFSDGTHQLKFMSRAGFSSTVALEFGYVTNPEEQGSFVLIETKNILPGDYQEYIFDPGTDYDEATILAIRHPGLQITTALLDDMSWEAKPTQPVFAISPEAWDFGEVEVGEASTPAAFIISNSGIGILTVNAPSVDNANFILDFDEDGFPALLEGNNTVSVNVIFAPMLEGAINGDMSISYDDSENTAIIPLTGLGFVRPEGSTCENPIVVDGFPFIDAGQTTCGMGNDYNLTCLGNYDGGEDIIYRFTLDELQTVKITFDPKSTTWTGIALATGCPPTDCIAVVSNAQAIPRVIEQMLVPGEYYVMIDTYPAPNCIPEFDLTITAEAPGLLSGTVSDGMGMPLEGVEVSVIGAEMQTTTDAGGFYEFTLIADAYDVSFSKFGFEALLVEDVEVDSEGVTLDVALAPAVPYALPFIERWNGASFTDQQWDQGISNWVVTGASGNPKPTAMFNWTPRIYNYERLLSSYYLDGAGETEISIQFDFLLSNFSTATTEQLIIKIYDGNDWYEVGAFDNQGGNIPWTTVNIEISDFAAGKLFFVGFFAIGQDSWNINHWYVDNIYVHAGDIQKVMLPGANSWGYISSYIEQTGKVTLEETLDNIIDAMTIMIGSDGIFWPGQNINTIGSWDTQKGYKIRMAEAGELALLGSAAESKTITFSPGIHIIPVLSQDPVSTALLFGGHDIEFAFDLAGAIYWPTGGVFTLNTLYPGFGYLVMFNQATTLDFNVSKHQTVPNIIADNENITKWNDVTKTGDVHIVGISQEAASILSPGDFIGVFNSDGLCVGMTFAGNSAQATTIAVHGNDMTTLSVDGMNQSEPMHFRLFSNGEIIHLEPVYSHKMPNYDGNFSVNGYSLITSLKAGSTGLDSFSAGSVNIYPNPTTGLLFINGFDGLIDLEIISARGSIVWKENGFAQGEIDLSGNAPGVYFVRYVMTDKISIQKIILR